MQAVRLVNTLGMAQDEWKAYRTQGIGGSDISAIVGINPYKSRFEVWLEKTGQAEETEETDAIYFGRKLEAFVADEFSERNPEVKVQRVNAILQHPEHPMFLANIDRLVKDKVNGDSILEIKTTSEWNRKAWDEGKVPDHACLQAQWYMGIVGCKKAYIAALIGGNKYRQYEVQRDDELIAYLQQMALEFWRLVESNTPPDPDGSTACTEAITKLYPEAPKGSTVQLPATTQALVQEYNQAKEQEKTWATRKDEVENKLKALLGSNELGLLGDTKVKWSVITKSGFDSKKLKAEHPDIYSKYASESTYRRFEVK